MAQKNGKEVYAIGPCCTDRCCADIDAVYFLQDAVDAA